MAAQRKAVEEAADELYALSPAEFTGARDERAKALRKEGHRDDADAVKALRKPTVAAWALNQLARERPKELGRLLAAGENLRAAQDELLAGGDRKAFRDAAAKERDEVAKLAGEATKLAVEAGERASPALTDKVAATLHAAALDEETAEELRAGRLVREREAIGGFGAISAEAPPRSRGAPSKRPEAGRTGAAEEQIGRGAEGRVGAGREGRVGAGREGRVGAGREGRIGARPRRPPRRSSASGSPLRAPTSATRGASSMPPPRRSGRRRRAPRRRRRTPRRPTRELRRRPSA